MKRYTPTLRIGRFRLGKDDHDTPSALPSMSECKDGGYIEHSPLHEAAPKMYAMLEECAILLRDGTQKHAEDCAKQVEKLLAEARGE